MNVKQKNKTMPRKKKEPIKVLNAVIIDNRKDKENWFVTFKYDGIRVDMDCNDAHGLYDKFRRVLIKSDPDIKEIELKFWFVEDKLLLKRTDIYNMYVKLKNMFQFGY